MRSPAWFGEGDEKIYIDGEAKPSIWGTGTEDYFHSAWVPAAPRRHGNGDVEKASDEMTGGDLLVYRPARPGGDWLEIPFEVGAKEPLRLEIGAVRSPDGGLYQAYLGGVKIGEPLDFYGGAGVTAVFPLLDFWPDPSRHVLRLEAVGQDPRSAGRACAVASVRLLERRPRVAGFGHDRDKDWRKAPRLYYGNGCPHPDTLSRQRTSADVVPMASLDRSRLGIALLSWHGACIPHTVRYLET